MVNQESSLAVRITGQTYEEGKADVDETLFKQPPGYVTSVMEEGSFFRILVSEKVLPPGIKPYDKAKSEAITKYQDYLEAEWLDELSEKYPVEINEQAFEQLFK